MWAQDVICNLLPIGLNHHVTQACIVWPNANISAAAMGYTICLWEIDDCLETMLADSKFLGQNNTGHGWVQVRWQPLYAATA